MDRATILKLNKCLSDACKGNNLPFVVALITNKYENIYEGGVQNSNLKMEDNISGSSIFYLASMTKPITTAAALLLSHQKLFSLDEPITKWIPSLKNLNVLHPNASQILKPERQITARDLMTHSSGFAHPTWSNILANYKIGSEIINKCYGGNISDDIGPLLFNPGERWEYSNTNIDLLAIIIEQIAGFSFREFIKQNILDPLGMSSTDWILTESMQSKKVSKYLRAGNGMLRTKQENETDELSTAYGSGGLYGSADDYAKFLRCIMNKGILNGKQILPISSVDQMTSSQFQSENIGVLKSTNQQIAKDIDLLPNTRGEWTYGFLINKTTLNTGRSPGSLTWFGSHNTYFWIDIQRNVSGIFLTQLTPCGDEKAFDVFQDFERTYYSNVSAENDSI